MAASLGLLAETLNLTLRRVPKDENLGFFTESVNPTIEALRMRTWEIRDILALCPEQSPKPIP